METQLLSRHATRSPRWTAGRSGHRQPQSWLLVAPTGQTEQQHLHLAKTPRMPSAKRTARAPGSRARPRTARAGAVDRQRLPTGHFCGHRRLRPREATVFLKGAVSLCPNPPPPTLVGRKLALIHLRSARKILLRQPLWNHLEASPLQMAASWSCCCNRLRLGKAAQATSPTNQCCLALGTFWSWREGTAPFLQNAAAAPRREHPCTAMQESTSRSREAVATWQKSPSPASISPKLQICSGQSNQEWDT
mmetsp:Transcript_916/g.2044  ORF Transcript_916/g.2044 Transcript_916/m.2044 type:complete len:249 (+) Transcript_916:137-883(+)